MSEDRPLDQAGQDALLLDVLMLLTHELPPQWEAAAVRYAALGPHAETVLQVRGVGRADWEPADAPAALGDLFARLRAGMHTPDAGTWFTAAYTLAYPYAYEIAYDAEREPAFQSPPPPDARAEELARFPRPPHLTPSWLAAPSAPSDGPDAAGSGAGGLRVARAVDGRRPDGSPLVERPDVPGDQRDAVVRYLEQAPIVLAARSFDGDLFDDARAPKVPLTFHTDGTWVWPGAVGYYLRAHGVPPERELVDHIRSGGFRVPEVSEDARNAAIAVVTGAPRS
ncbi:hypothetical protein [Actinomadura parmotrematis]|uniref:Ferredoxin n=1 Tax=Actinomadura parmotrematis TaxID=2864039 RepID=A0ABS7FXY4_9ACTN|nr:hypothetical protein [Actinomadura parmotrematis]MBW8485282.1 hypothetical protein [Actinomadura parmotrematis]